MPEISVIIPTYNRAQMLARALRSVLAQTEPDWECLIIDDGSTDDTRAVVESFAEPRFRYLSQANQGPAAARNNGIPAAQSPYITFLDSDDQMLPEKLALHLEAFRADDQLGLLASGWKEIDARGNLLRERLPWLTQPSLELASWLNGCPVLGSALTVRKACLDQVGLFNPDLRVAEDYDLWLRLAYAGCEMRWLPQVVCLRELHPQGISRHYAEMSRCLPRMFEDFFAHPDLPAEIAARRDQVFARLHVENTGRALAAGDLPAAREQLEQAVQTNPALLLGDPPRILDTLASLSQADYAPDREIYLKAWAELLANDPLGLGRSSRQLDALLCATEAFDASYRGNKPLARQKALDTLKKDPSWVRNRGLLKLLLKF